MTMAGVQEVAVIEECSCVSDPELCHRIEERVTHFPGTPFEIPVDVGRCSGPCNTGKSDPVSLDSKCIPDVSCTKKKGLVIIHMYKNFNNP